MIKLLVIVTTILGAEIPSEEVGIISSKHEYYFESVRQCQTFKHKAWNPSNYYASSYKVEFFVDCEEYGS